MPLHPVPCCIEAPPSYEAKARYALKMLLRPLGLQPAWSTRADLAGHCLYYGVEGEGLPGAAVHLPLHLGTVSYFAGRSEYDVERIRWIPWDGERWPVLFGGSISDEVDLVASTFFWLSGWQEYTTAERDPFGRFPHHASLQARLHTTARPVVDAYRVLLGQWLDTHGIPTRPRHWRDRRWALCPTHDIDYLKKWRPGLIYRETAEYLLLNRRHEAWPARLERFRSFLKDWAGPGDAYRRAFERMQAETEHRDGTATYFIKTGAHGPHDVAYNPGSAYLRGRLAALREAGFEVGLHPSFHAHTHPDYLLAERDRVAALTGAPPASVRQHYLRWEMPATARLQAQAGFYIDSTLGFAEHEGFRHGTCLPFQLYDPYADAPLDLWEMPLAVMESTLFNRRGLDPDGARAATEGIMDACRRFGGVAVMLWHNTLWDELDYPGWGQHFLDTLNYAFDREACITSLQRAFEAFVEG